VSDVADAFLKKAEESLAGARSEIANGRFNNAANRMYYACFQSAVAALLYAGVQRPPGDGIWSHGQVQREFSMRLVGNRNPFPTEFAGILTRSNQLRTLADYKRDEDSRSRAERHLTEVVRFVEAITNYIVEGRVR
jgi:uncharacterized protein (UPF0332 family)